MNLTELAQALVAANQNNKVSDLLDRHYSPDAVSVEAMEMPELNTREAVGLEAIRAKHAWWDEQMAYIDGSIDGPYLHGEDRFAVVYKSRMKEIKTGQIHDMEEVGIYHVQDGKIVREEFFYTM